MRKQQIVAALLAIACSVGVGAKETLSGQAVWQKHNCASCHGADAKSAIANNYPILAGQHAEYLAQALRSYQRGQAGAPATSNIRKNPVMGALSVSLSRAEIEAVSAWLATLESPLSMKR